jgi:sterol desaturase/sphingolipid hydroxylase (fatty acid hydroxylase superfamily)
MVSNFGSLSVFNKLAALDWGVHGLDLLAWAILGVLAAMLVVQVRVTGSDPAKRRLMRDSVRANLSLMLFNDFLLSAAGATVLLRLADQVNGHGLLVGISNPVLSGLLAFLLLDLTHYVWHWANHRWDALWAFHRVHHSDLSMNASTAFRLHFAEVLLTVLVKAVFIVATGVNATLVLVSEGIMALFVVFHHTDVTFSWDGRLSRVIVVPSLHRVHHSVLREEHDHNYGAVFSIWDRLFGTLAELEPARLGIRQVGSQSFVDLLRFGFAPLAPTVPPAVNAMIAEAAYFKAEKRGFAPGMEIPDWLDAEREILDRFARG